jgi:hypothetical protein
LELDQITEIIKTSIKDAYDEGFVDGSTKQAILEIQGRDRFLEELRASQPAIEPDLEKLGYCPKCGVRPCDCKNLFGGKKAA